MIEIESGIPIPERKSGALKWAPMLLAMKSGDSFVVRNLPVKASVCSSAKNAGVKICTRKTEDGQYRIWRIA